MSSASNIEIIYNVTKNCEGYCRKDYSKTIWSGQQTFVCVHILIMVQVFSAIIASRLLYFVLRPLKQPKFVCSVLGGIILGPSVLAHNPAIKEVLFVPYERVVLNTLTLVGAMYSVFLIAVKIDASMVLRTTKNAWSIGIAGFALPLSTLFVLISLWYKDADLPYAGKTTVVPFFMAAYLSISFYPVVANALEELDLITTELGQLALSSALVNDVINWFFMSLGVIFLKNNVLLAIKTFAAFFAFMLFAIFVVRPTIVLITKKTPQGKEVHEEYVVLILLGVLVMGFITDFIGTSVIYGPLILGLIIPDGPPLGSILVEKSELIVSEFFLPLLFVRVGYEMDVHAIQNWGAFIILWGILFAGYFAKFVGTVLASLFFKMRPKHAFLLGLIMNNKGIIELISYFRWRDQNIVDEQSYTVIVLSMLAMTAIVSPLTEVLYKPKVRLDMSNKHQHMRAVQTMPHVSEFRIISCIHSEENVPSMISLLEASSATEVSPICAYVIHLMELVGRAAPLLIHLNKQRRRSFMRFAGSYSNSDHILSAFENYAMNTSGRVTVQPLMMIAPYKGMHRNICGLAKAKLAPLIIVPYHENQHSIQGNCIATAIRDLNTNIQQYAPCTVGVLVDRGLRTAASGSHFSYHVAVVFIGGQDDREALAYAARMSGHADVSVTVMRIILCDKIWESEYEKLDRFLDEALYDEFKIKSLINACVVCKEVVVEDSIAVIDAIRSLECNYDLVMVGRHHQPMVVHDVEMPAFVEHEDLGLVGDVLASTNFDGGCQSVLVLRTICR